MRASGLDYETLRAVEPDIIIGVGHLPCSGGGPCGDRIGFDGAGQVMSGATYRQRRPISRRRAVVPCADFRTALTLTIGARDGALPSGPNWCESQRIERTAAHCAPYSNAFLIERGLLEASTNREWATAVPPVAP